MDGGPAPQLSARPGPLHCATGLHRQRTQPADLIPVAGGGTGIMLIRRDVLERLAAKKGTPRIWEARTPSDAMRKKFDREGKPITMWTEDINFCLEVHRLLGVQIMGDT